MCALANKHAWALPLYNVRWDCVSIYLYANIVRDKLLRRFAIRFYVAYVVRRLDKL